MIYTAERDNADAVSGTIADMIVKYLVADYCTEFSKHVTFTCDADTNEDDLYAEIHGDFAQLLFSPLEMLHVSSPAFNLP
jgi:hypothetical protein